MKDLPAISEAAQSNDLTIGKGKVQVTDGKGPRRVSRALDVIEPRDDRGVIDDKGTGQWHAPLE